MKRPLHAAIAALLAALALLGGAVPAVAHELSMAEMELREGTRGEFTWQWVASGNKPASAELKPVWPSHCTAEDNLLHCGSEGLSGRVHVDGVGQRYSAALLKVFWNDGQTRVYTLTAGQPAVTLYGSADDRRGLGEIASAYTVLGLQHILSGYDHLLFVIGLLFLVGFQRRLVWTITAFTAAHSLTLGLAALGWLRMNSAPVEACIALSIVLVAVEALRRRQTLARRLPALVAFGFGLVHGLGFAGVLAEIGLPQQHLLPALLCFNVGVELGQLLAVGLAGALVWALRRWPQAQRLRVPALYAIGSLASCWTWARAIAILG